MSTHKLLGDIGTREGTNTLSGQNIKDVSAHSGRQQDRALVFSPGQREAGGQRSRNVNT